MNLKITITKDMATPAVRRIISALDGAHRRELNAEMGDSVKELTIDHLRKLAAERHKTATDLGGTPTGHLARAADVVENTPLQVDDEAATLTLNYLGVGRALHDVTITPTKAKALTIPMSAAAYGHRAGEFAGLFLIKGENILAITTPGGIVPMFALVRSITQKQDRSLLPSDSEFETAAAEAAERYAREVKYGLQSRGIL